MGIKVLLDYCKDVGHHMALLTNGNAKEGVKIRALHMLQWFKEEDIFISEVTRISEAVTG